MKSVNRVNAWLLPVTHVNSNNTAWHLDTRREKNKKKKRVGSRWSLWLTFPEEFAASPPLEKRKKKDDEHPGSEQGLLYFR